MTGWFQDTAAYGSLLLAIPVAVIAGLVSFFSPCVIPLLPGYLSYATGLSGADLAEGRARRGRMLAGSLLFVLGFSVVFVGLGVASASVVLWFNVNERTLAIVLGSLTILLGVAFLGLVPWLQRDVRIHKVPAVGLAVAPLLGILFGLGWTPCIGPTLVVILTLAATSTRSAAGCCSPSTPSGSASRSSWPAWPGSGCWAPSRSCAATSSGSPASAARCSSRSASWWSPACGTTRWSGCRSTSSTTSRWGSDDHDRDPAPGPRARAPRR